MKTKEERLNEMKFIEIIKKLEEQIKYEKGYWTLHKEHLDRASWSGEEGVILSVNDAEILLKALAQNDILPYPKG